MQHWQKIEALPPDAQLYNIHTGQKYLRKHLEPKYLNPGKNILNEFYDKISEQYIDANLLREEGDHVRLRAIEYKRL